jgi:hypothetical protein
VSAGALEQGSFHLTQLPTLQLGFPARSAGAAQGRRAASFPFCIPPTHALATDFELMGDRGQNQFACREQTGGLFASALQGLEIAARTNQRGHASIIKQAGRNVTILREYPT